MRAYQIIMAKKATKKPGFTQAQVQAQRASALLSNMTAQTVMLDDKFITKETEEGRMAFLVFLAGEDLARLDNMSWATPGQAVYGLCQAVLAKLYKIKFSHCNDAVTRFVKSFLAHGPEGRMKHYIRAAIKADPDLEFRNEDIAATYRRRLIARSLRLLERNRSIAALGNGAELVYSSSATYEVAEERVD